MPAGRASHGCRSDAAATSAWLVAATGSTSHTARAKQRQKCRPVIAASTLADFSQQRADGVADSRRLTPQWRRRFPDRPPMSSHCRSTRCKSSSIRQAIIPKSACLPDTRHPAPNHASGKPLKKIATTFKAGGSQAIRDQRDSAPDYQHDERERPARGETSEQTLMPMYFDSAYR